MLREFCIPVVGARPQVREGSVRAPGPGEVQIAVEAIGLNFSDVLRSDDPAHIPFVPGAEVAGRVVAVGSGVELHVDDEILALLPERGGCADFVVAPASHVILRGGLSAETGAGSLLTFTTAMLAIDGCQLRSGDMALIHAAGGGVGSAALQLLKRAAVTTVALARTPAKAHLARVLGAVAVVDPDDDDVIGRLRSEAPDGFHAVLDGVGGPAAWEIDRSVTRPGARIALFGFAAGRHIHVDIEQDLIRHSLRIFGFAASERTRVSERLALFERTVLPDLVRLEIGPVLDAVIPVTELGWGLERLRSRQVVGKLVVTL